MISHQAVPHIIQQNCAHTCTPIVTDLIKTKKCSFSEMLRRELYLWPLAKKLDHIWINTMTSSNENSWKLSPPKIKSWLPPCLESWRAKWESATPPAQFLVTPAVCLPSGSELTRSLLVARDKLRTGVGRFGTCLYLWGMLDTPKCICGAEEQLAIYLIRDCDTLRSLNCLEDLRSPNINNTKWLKDPVDFVWTAVHTQEEVVRFKANRST